MTAITLLQRAASSLGIVPPDTLHVTDNQVRQLVQLANIEGQLLAKRHDWQVLSKEATFTTLATEIQASLATVAPGLRSITNETMWNRTLNRPVFGPLSPSDWQMWKSAQIAGPYNEYRIREGSILFFPTPVAGQSIFFEFVTRNWCKKSTGAPQDVWLDDSDIGLLDEDLMLLGLIWRWKRAKGFDYAEEYATYERQVATDFGRDGSKPTIDMSGARRAFDPVVIVPTGSW